MNALTRLARTIAGLSGRFYQLTSQGVNQFRLNGFGDGIEVSLQYVVVLHRGEPHLVPRATVSPNGITAFDVLIVRQQDAERWNGIPGLIVLRKADSAEVAWIRANPGVNGDLHRAGEELDSCVGAGMLSASMSGGELDHLEYRNGQFFPVVVRG